MRPRLQTPGHIPPDGPAFVLDGAGIMLDLLELLVGVLDVFSGGGDFLQHWRFCVTFGIATGGAILLFLHLPWETGNAIISGLVFLVGTIAGLIWETSRRSY